MRKFTPSLLDRLLDDTPSAGELAHRQLTLEQVKESVARDLEALLNSRCALDIGRLREYGHVARSVVGFGIPDFVSLNLASVRDRDEICRSIEEAVAAQEPRLRSVRVRIDTSRQAINRLYFSIQALLMVKPATEPVTFDALLQPSTLRYSVSQARRVGMT
jgi:type VI secretion system protein ImpF